jgi:hypothetical protein
MEHDLPQNHSKWKRSGGEIGGSFRSGTMKVKRRLVLAETPTNPPILVLVVLQADLKLMDGLVDRADRFHSMTTKVMSSMLQMFL